MVAPHILSLDIHVLIYKYIYIYIYIMILGLITTPSSFGVTIIIIPAQKYIIYSTFS